MPSKPRFTPEQHADMGRVLAAVRDELQHRRTELLNAYPQTGQDATPAKKVADAVRALDEARDALENTLYREHPDTATTHVYAPPSDVRQAARASLATPAKKSRRAVGF